MSITRVSLAELLARPREFSAEENAFYEGATDDDLHRNALADPDAQPWTEDMFRAAQAGRRRRLGVLEPGETVRQSARLDFTLEVAEAGQHLPLWAVTDERGRTVVIQAARIDRATPKGGARAFKIVPSGAPEDQ